MPNHSTFNQMVRSCLIRLSRPRVVIARKRDESLFIHDHPAVRFFAIFPFEDQMNGVEGQIHDFVLSLPTGPKHLDVIAQARRAQSPNSVVWIVISIVPFLLPSL
jgi:hypothetical protein